MPEAHSISVPSNPVRPYPGHAPGAFVQPTSLYNTLTSYTARNTLCLPFYTDGIIIVGRSKKRELLLCKYVSDDM